MSMRERTSDQSVQVITTNYLVRFR